MTDLKNIHILLLANSEDSLISEYNILAKMDIDILMTTDIDLAVRSHADKPFDIVLLEGSELSGDEIKTISEKLSVITAVPTILVCEEEKANADDTFKCLTQYGCIFKGNHEYLVYQTIIMALRLFVTDQRHKKEKQKLDTSQDLFIHVCESMRAGILVLDTDYKYSYWNKAMETITGKSRVDVLGDTLHNHFPDLKEEVLDAKRLALAGQPVFDLEREFEYPDKSLGIASHSFMPLYNDNNEVYGILGVVRDITSTKNYEKELVASEKRYRELVDSSFNAVVVHNQSRILFANKAALKMLGAEHRRDLKGRNLNDFIHDQSVDVIRERMTKVMRGEQVPFIEQKLVRLDGSEFYAEVTGNLVSFNDEPAIQVIAHDITEKKLAEKEMFKMIQRLSDNESLLTSINKNLFEGLYRTTKEDTFIYVNHGFAKMFGYKDVAEVMKLKPSDFYANPEIRDKKLGEIAYMGDVENDEVLLKRKDGSTFWGLVSSSVVYNDDSSVRYYDGAIHNITARKEHEQHLETSLKEKEILLAEIHHRVKNNLAVISGLIDLQRFTMEDENAKSILLDTQNRILSIAKVHELLYGSENFADISIQQLLEQLSSGISNSFNSEDLDVNFNIDANHITMNATQAIPFGLLLNELINNSYKHAFVNRNKGSVEITLSESGEFLNLTYKDDGIGLPNDFEEIIERNASLGFSLIKTLSLQLDGFDISIEGKNGFSYSMMFSKEHHIQDEPAIH